MTWLRQSRKIVRLKDVYLKRVLATTSSSTPFQVFNTETKRHQRNRAAIHDPETSRRTDYLRDEVATRLIERFMVLCCCMSLTQLINRRFDKIVDFGSGSGHLAKAMTQAFPPPTSDEVAQPPKDS